VGWSGDDKRDRRRCLMVDMNRGCVRLNHRSPQYIKYRYGTQGNSSREEYKY